MSSFPLNEQQQVAKESIGCNVSVSAGAGSGKTRVLVERFIYILEQGIPSATGKAAPEQVDAAAILAITFTRKAAGEMKERVRKSIEAYLEQDVQGYWHGQLEALNRAQISTIHGLCSRILRENPVEAQLDPNFIVAEEFTGSEFLQDCVQRYLRQELRQQNAGVRRLVEAYGAGALVGMVLGLVPQLEAIAAEADLCAAYTASLAELPLLKDELCRLVRDLVISHGDIAKKTTKAGQALEAMAELVEDICAGIRQEPADFSLLHRALQGVQARGKIKDYLLEIRALEERISLAAYDRAALELIPCWQQLFAGLADYIRTRKQEQDFLTYDDLENFTVELLQHNEQVRHKYQERYKYIMVDEFQDTNDRQRQLIYLLCGDSSEQLYGQKLFIVGDPKQSIYRFRGADVSVFARVRREIAAGGGVCLQLNKNYRSADKILLAVNSAFRLLMGEDSSRDVFFEALEANKQSEALPQLLQVPYDKECGRSKYQVEAEAVALALKAYHEGRDYQGRKLLAPKLAYGEMAVLLRAMTHVQELADALQAQGIPYEIIDGRGFYERQEVVDLLNLLTVLHNRYHGIELAGILRSPYFGLNDETLTRLFLMHAPCLWDALQQARPEAFGEGQGALVERAAKLLEQLRAQAALLALPELWQCVWQQLAVEAVLSVQEHGANRLANAQKLRRLAQEYSAQQGGDGTLAQWLAYVQRLRSAEVRETTANLATSDAVRIMTIHKSKGLEFKFVLLPFLNSSGQPDNAEIKYLPQVGLGIKAPDDKGVLQTTSVLQQAREADHALELEERKRQLYVAMTRAEEYLLLSGITDGKELKADKSLEELSWYKQLLQLYKSDEVAEIITLEQGGSEEKAVPLSRQKAGSTGLEHLAALPSYQDSGRRVFTPSALQTYLFCPRKYFYKFVQGLPELEEEHNGLSEGSGNRLPARTLGLVIHKALELYRDNLDEALAVALKEHAPAYRGNEAKQLLEAYLASDLYRSLPKQQLRELPFVLYTQQGLQLNGVVDYLGWNEDGSLTLVDYKTGRPPAAGESINGYAYQLAIYREAVEQRLGKRVTKAQLHFLQNNSIWELPQQDNAKQKQYLQEAYALCEKIGKMSTEADFVCICERFIDEDAENCKAALALCAQCPYNYVCNHK